MADEFVVLHKKRGSTKIAIRESDILGASTGEDGEYLIQIRYFDADGKYKGQIIDVLEDPVTIAELCRLARRPLSDPAA